MPPPIPRVTVSTHRLDHADDVLHLTILSDLHIDSPLCDYDGLKAMCRKRAKLPNHIVVGIGDMCDLVMPGDLKRFRPSVQKPHIATRDDFMAAAVEEVGGLLEDLAVKWTFIGKGNHEDEALKRHGWDATSILAARLGCAPAGYSGCHDFRLLRSKAQTVFRLVWHHGKWGGEVSGGLPGAARYFSKYDAWHLAAYGHNHSSVVRPETRWFPDPAAGVLRERTVYIVNCASWVYAQDPDARKTHYTERSAFSPQPRISPLIRIRIHRTRQGGESRIEPEYSVEV